MKLLIDIGNTSAKLAIADPTGEMLHTERLAEAWGDAIARLCRDYSPRRCVVSCVGYDDPALHAALSDSGLPTVWLSASTPCDIQGIPEGYGADRLAADIGAYAGQRALLVVDAGTCITYDLIVDGTLCGGVISPGVQLRLRAMHDHTAALPLVDAHSAGQSVALMPCDTVNCMLSAALHGVRYEVEGYVRSLMREYPDLCVVLTGGNRVSLPDDIPHTYDPLLVLRGLCKL